MNLRLLIVAAMTVCAVACGKSDSGITTSVKSQLVSDDLVKARNINVDTTDRVVTLTGEVNSQAEAEQALQLARATDGVTNVIDRLEIVSEGPSAVDSASTGLSDAATTAEVKAKLLADTSVAGLSIDVDTSDHVVMLTGTVNSAAEKDKAIQLAGEVAGVTSVQDKLSVRPR